MKPEKRRTGGESLASRVFCEANTDRADSMPRRRRGLRPAIGLCVLLMVVGPATAGAAVSQRVATVNGQSLAGWELERDLTKLISSGSFHRRVPEERMAEIRCEALRDLVFKELKRQWAANHPAPVDPATAQRAWQEVRNRFGSDKQYRAALELKGISEAEFLAAFDRDAVAAAVDAWLISGVSPPSDTEVAVFFTLHSDEYTTPEARRVVHVLFHVSPAGGQPAWDEAAARAAALVRRANDEAVPLLDLAGSEIDQVPPRFADQVGDLGFVHRGSLVPAVDEAVFSVEVGSVTGPIRSIYGYHVLEVVDSRPPQPLSLDQVREAVGERVAQQRIQRAMDRFDDELLDGAVIEVDECGGGF